MKITTESLSGMLRGRMGEGVSGRTLARFVTRASVRPLAPSPFLPLFLSLFLSLCLCDPVVHFLLESRQIGTNTLRRRRLRRQFRHRPRR